MQLIPVVDLLGGRAVRAAGNRPRGDYAPLESVLAIRGASLESLTEGLQRLSPPAVYVADLDAIERRPSHGSAIATLLRMRTPLWLDAGLRRHEDAEALLASQAADSASLVLIAGLETLGGPEELSQLVERFGPNRVVFSLDLRAGRPLGNLARWGGGAEEAARTAVECGALRMIVLDLATVGRCAGVAPHALELCARLGSYRHVELVLGGGVRGEEDLRSLAEAGCSAALVGAALHQGRISAADFRRWNAQHGVFPGQAGEV